MLQVISKKLESLLSFLFQDQRIKDTPFFPYAWGRGLALPINNPDEPLIEPLKVQLEKFNPELLNRLYFVVYPAAENAQKEEEAFSKLLGERQTIATELAQNKAALKESLKQLPRQPKEAWYEIFLTVGMSLLLFIGFCEVFGLEIQSLTSEQYPLAVLCLGGAACINVAEKLTIHRFVQSLHLHLYSESFNVPWWQRLKDGDSVLWFAVTLVVFETCFATPGLLSLLPPRVASQWQAQLLIITGAGLAALANVGLAWSTALVQLDWKRDFLQAKQQIALKNQEFRTQSAAAKASLLHIEKQISQQKKIVSDAFERARLEHSRWEHAVREWMQKHYKN